MRFDLTPEQQLLQRTARDFFGAEVTSRKVRALHDRQLFGLDIWQAMARQGWLGTLIAEKHGGLGLTMDELFPVMEEAARAVAPMPLLESAVVVPLLIQQFASSNSVLSWLPKLADGSAIGTVAWFEDADIAEPLRLGVSARPCGSSWILDGKKDLVAFGADASILIVLASISSDETASRTEPTRLGLFAVPAHTAGLVVKSIPHADLTARFAKVSFDQVQVPKEQVLGEPGFSTTDLAPVIRAAQVALCMDMVGATQRVVEMCVAYAKQRVQFDRPIGSFQVIKHKLVDMYAQSEWIRGLTYAATSALIWGDLHDPIVEVCKATCNEAYRFVTHEGIQVHGGTGFTWKHDIHLFYKRAMRYCRMLGTTPFLLYSVGHSLSQGYGYEECEAP